MTTGEAATMAAKTLCPCGCVVVVTHEGDVMHALPTCPDYDRLEPVEFLRWLNERHRQEDP